MENGKYILVDEGVQQVMLNEIRELKKIMLGNLQLGNQSGNDVLMDTADLMQYLKLDRRTIYTYRLKGMPYVQKDNGRLFFWKSAVDKYFGKEM